MVCRVETSSQRKELKIFSSWVGRENSFITASHHVLSPLPLQVLCAFHALPPLSSWHWPEVAVHVSVRVRNRCGWYPSHDDFTKWRAVSLTCNKCRESAFDRVGAPWMIRGEWMNKGEDHSRHWPVVYWRPTPPYIMLPLLRLGASTVAFPGQKLCAGLAPEWNY